jgi:hypothetical protein
MKKQFLIPVLVAPPVTILIALFIISMVATVYYLYKPLEINRAGFLSVVHTLSIIGLACAYGVTTLVVLPIFRLAIRHRVVSGLSILLVLAVVLSVLWALALLWMDVPLPLAFIYGGGTLLPCAVGGAFAFWLAYVRSMRSIR